MESETLLEITGLSAINAGKLLLKDIAFKIRKGDCMAVVGGTGSGKSTLLRCIERYRYYPDQVKFSGAGSPKIVLISHQHQFTNLSGINNFYYQQRFNSTESEDSATVLQDLLSEGSDAGEITGLLKEFEIGYTQDSPLIQLSNGEHKRFQLVKAILKKAEWLLLDNPFTGLDPKGREKLEQIIKKIINRGINVLTVVTRFIPSFITDVIVLDKGVLKGIYPREIFLRDIRKDEKSGVPKFEFIYPSLQEEADFEYAVRMINVGVRYHDRDILKSINWSVKKGDRWCLSGPNGSGKSTLLSLITADNPQAFANDIYLFDRKRGSGETIWEIKEKIGYISPELHQHFGKNFTCLQVVASGLFDTIGLFRKLNKKQREIVDDCLNMFDIRRFSEKPLSSLSFGLQRWIMLARALVKNPPLLVLDEPCQGLDEELSRKFISFIEGYCETGNKTLIYVTHVEEEIPGGITHILKLQNGEIKELKQIWKKSLQSLPAMG